MVDNVHIKKIALEFNFGEVRKKKRNIGTHKVAGDDYQSVVKMPKTHLTD